MLKRVQHDKFLVQHDKHQSSQTSNVCARRVNLITKNMELKNNIKVVFAKSKIIHPLTIRHTQENSLMQTNTKNENINDINIKNMENFTGIELRAFI